jgi:hypothetical protein
MFDTEPPREHHRSYVLFVIALLLLTREVYIAISSGECTVLCGERLWYPLAALTEVIAVCLFATLGLVPRLGDQNSPLAGYLAV